MQSHRTTRTAKEQRQKTNAYQAKDDAERNAKHCYHTLENAINAARQDKIFLCIANIRQRNHTFQCPDSQIYRRVNLWRPLKPRRF
jgi:hypothetical protein